MSRTGPDFIIIGAMKCATSTLHSQLALQSGFYMSDPKEPNFFSDHEMFQRGFGWYASLFAGARPGDLCGESSTHYTKRPTYPDTVRRLHDRLPDAKLIYVMKNPLSRLVSHYIHEWSQRKIDLPLPQAVAHHAELVDYGRYAWQLEPFIECFGRDRILPVFVPHLEAHPDAALARVAAFLGRTGDVRWNHDAPRVNESARRLRLGPIARWVVDQPLLAALRRSLVPAAVRESIKGSMRMEERPVLDDATRRAVQGLFDEDLMTLGAWLGTPLSCERFDELTRHQALEWVA